MATEPVPFKPGDKTSLSTWDHMLGKLQFFDDGIYRYVKCGSGVSTAKYLIFAGSTATVTTAVQGGSVATISGVPTWVAFMATVAGVMPLGVTVSTQGDLATDDRFWLKVQGYALVQATATSGTAGALLGPSSGGGCVLVTVSGAADGGTAIGTTIGYGIAAPVSAATAAAVITAGLGNAQKCQSVKLEGLI